VAEALRALAAAQSSSPPCSCVLPAVARTGRPRPHGERALGADDRAGRWASTPRGAHPDDWSPGSRRGRGRRHPPWSDAARRGHRSGDHRGRNLAEVGWRGRALAAATAGRQRMRPGPAVLAGSSTSPTAADPNGDAEEILSLDHELRRQHRSRCHPGSPRRLPAGPRHPGPDPSNKGGPPEGSGRGVGRPPRPRPR